MRYDADTVVVCFDRIAAGVLAGYLAACGSSTAFVCAGDEECTLSGTPGICHASGACAYPDAACDSGFAFPAAYGGALGGTCAPGTGETDPSTDGDGDTGPGSGTAGDTDGTTQSVDGLDDATAGATSLTATGEGDTSGTSEGEGSGADTSDTATELCRDTVGDTPDTATVVASCEFLTSSILEDESDEDWYSLAPADGCAAGQYMAFLGSDSGNVSLCLAAQCPDEGADSAQCASPQHATTIGGYTACCSGSGFSATFSCAGEAAQGIYVRVAAQAGVSTTCEPYDVAVLF